MTLKLIIGNKNYSSWSLRPWLFLKYHGIPFEEVRIPLYQQESKAQILAWSPAGKVPVLADGELRVWDSLAILEYLAERFPETRAWPEAAADRALARAVSAEMHSGFIGLRTHCSMSCKRTPAVKDLPEDAQRDVARVSEIWRACRSRFAADGPWLFGRFTAADAMYAPVALRVFSYCLSEDPIVRAYVDTVLNDPHIAEWIAVGKQETEVIGGYDD